VFVVDDELFSVRPTAHYIHTSNQLVNSYTVILE